MLKYKDNHEDKHCFIFWTTMPLIILRYAMHCCIILTKAGDCNATNKNSKCKLKDITFTIKSLIIKVCQRLSQHIYPIVLVPYISTKNAPVGAFFTLKLLFIYLANDSLTPPMSSLPSGAVLFICPLESTSST